MVKVIKVLVVIIPLVLLGVDMDPLLGGVVGAGANLVGGIYGQRNQAAINTANINAAQNAAMYGIEWRVADAKRAGINPLAALGSNFSPGPATAVGSNALGAGVGAAGQDIARAFQAYGDKLSKSAELDNQLKQSQIDQINATTAGEMLRNSKMATMSQPGTPPGLGILDPSGNPVKTAKRLYEDYSTGTGQRVTLFSPDAQRSIFSGVPGAVTYPALAADLAVKNLPRVYGPMIRPDTWRWLEQHSYDPSLFGGGM